MIAPSSGFERQRRLFTSWGGWHPKPGLAVLFIVAVLASPANAATCSWNTTVADPAPADFTNTANWVGASVPGANDTALFTNKHTGRVRIKWSIPVSTAEAVVDYPQNFSGSHGLFLSNTIWTVSSRLALWPTTTVRTNSLYMQFGTLDVTNGARNAVFEVGSGIGLAQLQILGGTINVDCLSVTNTGGIIGVGTTSKIDGGTLAVFAGSAIISTNLNSNFDVGSVTNATLSYLGGSNLLRIASGRGLNVMRGSTLSVSGPGTLLVIDRPICASYVGIGNKVLVEKGATLTAWPGLTVGDGAGSIAGMVPLARAAGAVLVADGGVLRANILTTGTNGFGTVTVSNAVLEFSTAAPSIILKTPGSFVMTNGTVSFLGTNNVDVKGNWTASLTNITFQGSNTFRLNASINLNAASQAYTFGAGGATNYTRLELLNGAVYQGGPVTIGAGGSLAVPEGVGTVASNLTFQSAGSCEIWIGATGSSSRVIAGRDVSLGGAALVLHLTAPPQKDYSYVLIENTGANPVGGSFSSASVSASFDGKIYPFTIRKTGGDGNDVIARASSAGALMLVR